MKIRVLGCGWYGAHIALSLLADGHDVEILESSDHIFAGASGNNPARLHLGFHYPRSRLTRAMCQENFASFMARYGRLTAGVPVNIYAVASNDSLVDFGNYAQTLRGEIEFVQIDPCDYGLRNVEGAILTAERHIVIRKAREHFEHALGEHIKLNAKLTLDTSECDYVVDATFCANDAENIDRFEPCLTVLMEGPTDKSITIMDGQHPSLYVWDEEQSLSSLTSASLTPLAKNCRSWTEAKGMLDRASRKYMLDRAMQMVAQMAEFWPTIHDYEIVDFRKAVRAMPRSAADARLVDVVRISDKILRVRAGKIDAVLHAERLIKEMIYA